MADDREPLSQYYKPPPPPYQQGPSVETRLPQAPPQPDPQAGQAAFGVPPSTGIRPGPAAPAAFDPRYPAGQQGPSVASRMPEPPAGTPWYLQPHARVVPQPPADPGTLHRVWAKPATTMPPVQPGEPPRPGPVRAVLGQQAPVSPDATAGTGEMPYGQQMGKVGGWIADLAKTVVSAPGYGMNRPAAPAPGAQPGAPAVVDLMPPGGPSAAVAAAPAAPGAPAPVPAPAAAAAPAGQPVAGAPGAFKFVDPTGRVLYTDNPAGGGAPAGAPVTANTAPAAAAPAAVMGAPAVPANTTPAGAGLAPSMDAQLHAAQMAAVSRGETLGPGAAAGGLPALTGAWIPGVNAPASQGAAAVDERNERFDREVLMDRAVRAGGAQGGAIMNMIAATDRTRAGEREAVGREAGATQRTTITDTGQTQRERETNASKERTEGPLRAAQTTEAITKAQQGVATQKATAAYQAAVASGDPKKIQAAEDALRAAQGKWEKTQPDNFQGVAVPGGVDPATGMPTGSSVVVVNKSTGEHRVVSAAEAKSGAAAAAAPHPKAIEMLRANPKLAEEFDKKYGAGAAARALAQR